MHGRIIQISDEPIAQDDYIDEADYYEDCCVPNDWVATLDPGEDGTYRTTFEHCFRSPAFSLHEDDGQFYAVVEDREAYFKPRFEMFKENLEKLRCSDLAAFMAGEPVVAVALLNDAWNDRFGIWVDGDEYFGGPTTLDEWMRHAENGDKIYLGGVVDYHY